MNSHDLLSDATEFINIELALIITGNQTPDFGKHPSPLTPHASLSSLLSSSFILSGNPVSSLLTFFHYDPQCIIDNIQYILLYVNYI
jgi:hypothetical protein